MRMMALTTGVVSMTSNGQNFSFDYGVTHKGNVAVKWSETATSDPIEDIRVAKEKSKMKQAQLLHVRCVMARHGEI